MGTKTRFEEEAKGNSEMAYWVRMVNWNEIQDISCSLPLFKVIIPARNGQFFIHLTRC